MSKTYQEYCREALLRDPKTYSHSFNTDGTIKPIPKMTDMFKRNPSETQSSYLKKKKKNGWNASCDLNAKHELEITGTEVKIKGRIVDLITISVPKNCSRKEYKRIWMHNERVNKRIKKLKEQYGEEICL